MPWLFILGPSCLVRHIILNFFFFFKYTATTEIYTLSLHDALPICGRNQRCRTASDDRGELVAQRRPAIAEPRREGLRNERRLRAVHHVVRNERQHDREEDPGRYGGVEQREIEKAEDPGHRRADEIHPLA